MPTPVEPPRADERRAARVGLILFLIYLVAYGTFMGLCAFGLDLMARTVAGVNVAVLYGFGLIALALLLALIYMWLVRPGGGEGRAA